MTICDDKKCTLDAYGESSKCILHCKKSDYHSDRRGNVLESFNDALISHIVAIVEKVPSRRKNTPESEKYSLEAYLKGESDDEKDGSPLKKQTIKFQCVAFPSREPRDDYDYLKVLKKIESIHFDTCQFNLNHLELGDVRLFYQECEFHEKWNICNTPILDDLAYKTLYLHCNFHKEVGLFREDREDGSKYVIDSQLFRNCKFQEGLEFWSGEFNAPIFNNEDKMDLEIKSFCLIDCVLRESFTLNSCRMELFSLKNTIFESKFEFKCNVVEKFDISNTNYFKAVDTYKTKYGKFHIKESMFEGFVGFEKCVFGHQQGKPSKDFVAKFIYSTFLGVINFRNTKFNSGLDIERITLKEAANFLNTDIDPIYSNRETFRIIKHSFDGIGNHIEANKYFALEMKKYKEELQGTNRTQEKIILFLNEILSNYGQSYIRPIVFMVAASVIYSLLILCYELNVLYKIYPDINGVLKIVSGILNEISGNILPFGKILRDGMEFISLVFYLIFSILIWLVLVAVRRLTKR